MKEKCKELLKCETCVYYNPSMGGDECIKLTVRGISKDFGCIKHLSRNEKKGGCFSCKWVGRTQTEYYCRKEMLTIDDPFIIKDCYAYDKEALKFYPYPEVMCESNKVHLEIDSTLSDLIGSLLLVSLKDNVTVDNAINYTISLSDFYTLETLNNSMYKVYKEEFEDELVNVLIDIEKTRTEIDENEWLKGLVELVKEKNISIIDLMNHETKPTDLIKILTGRWLESKKGVEL